MADFCEVSAPELKPCLEPVEQCELLIYNGENVFSTHANRILVIFQYFYTCVQVFSFDHVRVVKTFIDDPQQVIFF